jgi:DNA-binding MarR family transcriptional regulator
MKDKALDIRTGTLHMTLIRLNKTHRKRTHEEFNKVGITAGQPKILDFLSQNNGCMQRELAKNCNIEPATVTSILANMEKSKLIYRTQNPKDRRVLNVFLTDKGKCAQREVEKIFRFIDEECFEGFSEMERKQTFYILNRLFENMAKGRKE